MEMIDQAIKVLEGRTAVSTTTLQRQLRIGYWQAGRLIGELKEQCRITEDWDASEGGYRVLGGGRTPLAPDAGDSAASSGIVQASALSTSQTESAPTQRG